MRPPFAHLYPDWLKIIFKRLHRLLQKNSIPSHWEKVVEVKKFRKKYGLTVFVETGTYQGAMIKAVNGLFKNIISIELGKELFENKTATILSNLSQTEFKLESKLPLGNGFGGNITKQGFDNLINNPDVKAIYLDELLHIVMGNVKREENVSEIIKNNSIFIAVNN